MTRYLVAVIIAVLSLSACKGKKSSNADHKDSTANQADKSYEATFFKAFNVLPLPFSVTDTNIAQLTKTDTISRSLFMQLVPDTLFINPFGKNRNFSVYPVGKIEQKGKETYFATFVKDKNHSALYLCVFDKKKLAAAMPLLTGSDNNEVNTASIDKKLSVVINKQWKVKGDPFYKRSIYAYSSAGSFTPVLTETNEDRTGEGSVLNPFDTFPKRNKYSGDYTKGKKNVLFIRDDKKQGQYLFFVHFESESKDESCDGELKGTFKIVSDKAGVYTGNGDPCVLNFSFKGNEAAVKETGSCGNYRGIKCFFNNTFVKKKEPKALVKR